MIILTIIPVPFTRIFKIHTEMIMRKTIHLIKIVIYNKNCVILIMILLMKTSLNQKFSL